LNLLVISQYFWPENFRINDLVQELVKRGHDVTVLTGRPNYPDGKIFADFKARPDEFAEYRGARLVRVPLIPRGSGRGLQLVLNYFSFAVCASLLGAWKLRKTPIDRIFVFEPSPITVGVPAAVLRWLRKVPVAFWVLDLWPETLEAIGAVKSRWLLRFTGVLVSWIYNRCDLILAQSKSFIPQIVRYCRYPHRIVYFASWAEAVYDLSQVERAPEVPEQPGAFNIVFAGNIGEAQDFPAIVAAAEKLRDERAIRWIIVGDGRGAAWLREEIDRRKLQSTVLMVGRYPIERMPSFYRHADALLMSLKPDPIFSLTIPGKLQSYLAAGIPVLAMIDGEGARLINEAGAGLACSAGDSEGLARQAKKLALMTQGERQAMGRRGRDISIAEFDRNTQIGKLENWLLELRYHDHSGVIDAIL
jgi:glycosyltransferase involved in cell wall biosynthesis